MNLVNKRDYGVSFTGAGLLTPYHLGVSEYLTKDVNFITDNTILAGSSGGALAAITTALKLNKNDALLACEYIAKECNNKGTRLTLRLALDTILNDLLPDNAAELINKRPASCSLSYTEVFPSIKSYTINTFQNKEDLIDCLRASCNIPFYFNGNSMTVNVRNGAGIDGFFSHQLNRFGAPSISTPYELVICPVRPNIVGLNPSPLLLRKTERMKQNLNKQKIDFQNIFNIQSNNNNGIFSDNNSDSNNEENDIDSNDDMIVQEIDIISPALLSAENWPFSTLQNLQLLVLPPTDQLGNFIDNHLESLARSNSNAPRVSGSGEEENENSSSSSINMLNIGKKIKSVRNFNNIDPSNRQISLIYNYVYNAGVLSAHAWYTSKQKKLKQKLNAAGSRR
jgi:hypothetical protein